MEEYCLIVILAVKLFSADSELTAIAAGLDAAQAQIQGQPFQACSSQRPGQGLLLQFPEENVKCANCLQLQKSLWLSRVCPRPCAALCDISASQPLALQAVLQRWPNCRRSRGSGHTCCTLLSLCAAWTVTLSLWDQAEQVAANREHSASLPTLSLQP